MSKPENVESWVRPVVTPPHQQWEDDGGDPFAMAPKAPEDPWRIVATTDPGKYWAVNAETGETYKVTVTINVEVTEP